MSDNNLRADLKIIVDIVPPGARVLDLGCGDGDLLTTLVQRKSVIGRGIELSEAGVRHCVSRGLSVRQGDIDVGLGDYPTGSFDYVILSQTLPYIDNPKVVLCEMLRVGRQAIVSFPNLGHWRARLQLLFRGRLPNMAFSSLPWYESPRSRPVSIADFFSFCAEANISVVEAIYLTDKRQLEGLAKRRSLATIGLFVLKEHCSGPDRSASNIPKS